MLRPFAGWTGGLLFGFLVLQYAAHGLTAALIYDWSVSGQVAVAIGYGFLLGFTLAEVMWRAARRPIIISAVRAPAIRWETDELPPPGYSLVSCARCGRTGALPTWLMDDLPPDVVNLCTDCKEAITDEA